MSKKQRNLNDKTARKVLEEAARRAKRKSRLSPETALFGPQLAFVQDRSRLKVACCSRRAGKSYGIAYGLLEEGFKHANSYPLYVNMSRSDAKNILWPALQDLDTKLNLGLSFKQNTGEVAMPNGSRILVRGAGSRREIDKMRGPKYPAAVIDEAQGFGSDLNYMIDEVLEPATLDYNGWIAVTGTPNAACAGPFHQMATNPKLGWSIHNWTLLDNPHLPNPQEWLKQMRQRRGWSENHPSYLREYRGVWVRDAEGLVFEFKKRRNTCARFPVDLTKDWSYILGVDVGFNDPTAFVVLAYSQVMKRSYIVESYKEDKLTPSASAAHVERFREKYDFAKIVVDTGGLGKGYAEEWRSKFHIPVTAAKKSDKVGYINLMNGDFLNGSLVIASDANKELIEELEMLQWDIDKMAQNRWEADRKFDDHLCDAALYAWRECKHHASMDVREGPVYGSAAYWQQVEDEMWDDLLKEQDYEDRPFWKKLKK